MYKVNTFVEPHYPIKRALLFKVATLAMESVNVHGKVELTVSVIGNRKMRQLNGKYRGIPETTDVLSFSLAEDKAQFVNPPDTKALYLGDVVISYPEAISQAAEESILIEEKVAFLLVHGLLHLLGYDHVKPAEEMVMTKVHEAIMKKIKFEVSLDG
ncbi:MAG: rRNA maturation RNase YbeY [Patescibacteria group bacterium]|nr:rRNA maturation RNase YbeY [Patescibacteria group bacterium]